MKHFQHGFTACTICNNCGSFLIMIMRILNWLNSFINFKSALFQVPRFQQSSYFFIMPWCDGLLKITVEKKTTFIFLKKIS